MRLLLHGVPVFFYSASVHLVQFASDLLPVSCVSHRPVDLIPQNRAKDERKQPGRFHQKVDWSHLLVWVPGLSSNSSLIKVDENRPALRDKMETVHLTFNELCRASRKLNAAFSFETFLYLCCSFVILTSSLHILISDLSSVSDKTFGIDIRFGEIVTCLMVSMAVLFILTNADLPAAQVRQVLLFLPSFLLFLFFSLYFVNVWNFWCPQASKLRDVVMDLSGRTQDPVEKQEVFIF